MPAVLPSPSRERGYNTGIDYCLNEVSRDRTHSSKQYTPRFSESKYLPVPGRTSHDIFSRRTYLGSVLDAAARFSVRDDLMSSGAAAAAAG